MKKLGLLALMMGSVTVYNGYAQEITPLPGSESTETTENLCEVAPSCENLGYTQTIADCKGMDNILRCPMDVTQMFCVKGGGSCDGDVAAPAVPGYILYADKTTSPDVVSGKAPIGVVFDSEKRLAVALSYSSSMAFVEKVSAVSSDGSSYSYFPSVPSRGNCGECSYDSSKPSGARYPLTEACLKACESKDGMSNTLNLVNYALTMQLPLTAAVYTYTFQPTACTLEWCKASKWFLPSMPEVYTLYQNREVVDAALTLVGAKPIKFPKGHNESYCQDYYNNMSIITSSAGYSRGFCVNKASLEPLWGRIDSDYYLGYVYPVISF